MEKKIHALTWNELPIPDLVIDRVHESANREGVPNFIHNESIFDYATGVPIDDDEEEEDPDEDEKVEDDDDYIFSDEDDEEQDEDDYESQDDIESDDEYQGEDQNDDVTKIEDKNEIEDDYSVPNYENNKNDNTNNKDNNTPERETDELKIGEDIETEGAQKDNINETQDATEMEEMYKDVAKKINNDVVENIKDNAENMSWRPCRSEKAIKRKEHDPSFRGKSYAQLLQMVKKEGIVDRKEISPLSRQHNFCQS